jgi:hypothetical protein
MTAPPPGSPYWSLDAALRDTLERSFDARAGAGAGAGLGWVLDDGRRLGPHEEARLNLANGVGGRSPASVWEAVQNAGAEWLSILVRVFNRMRAIDRTLALWRQIKYLRNGWWGGSGGFKVVYFDPAEMRSRLDDLAGDTAGPRVVRDQPLGSLEHQLDGSIKLLGKSLLAAPRALLDPLGEPPDAHTWREVDRPGGEGLHFCVSRHDGPGRYVKLDDVHLDWRSPVAGVGPHRRCQYTPGLQSLRHWMQAALHIEKPAFHFHETDAILASLRAPAGRLPPWVARARAALEDEWEAARWALAVQGGAGLEAARKYHARAAALVTRA